MKLQNLKLQDFRIGTRIALALALPIAGLLVFSLWVLAGYYRTAQDAAQIRSMATLASAAGDLVHALQQERGVSAGFTGAANAGFAEKLPGLQRHTDEKRADFIRSLAGFDARRMSSGLAEHSASAHHAVDQLAARRQALADPKTAVAELTAYYSETIEKLIDLVEEMQVVNADTRLMRTIYAYSHLIQAKEQAGRERAAGVASLAAGRRTPEDMLRLGRLVDRQRLLLDEFRTFASAEQAALLDAVLAGPDARKVDGMRLLIFGGDRADSRGAVDAAQWYDTLSRKIDLLKRIEDRVASDLAAQSISIKDTATRAVWWVAILAAAILAFTIALATVIARGIVLPLTRVSGAMNRLAAHDDTAAIASEDARRGDEIGDMARALTVFRDNLYRIAQAEERLKSEARHQALVESANDAIITADADGNVVSWNRRAEAIFGYAEAEVAGRPLTLLMPKRHHELYRASLKRALSGSELPAMGRMVEAKGLRKDQSEFPIELSLASWEIEGKRFVTGSVRDITLRKQADQQLRIAAIAFESQEGMMVTDAEKKILRVNHAFTDITGYSADEVVGRTPGLLSSGRHDAGFYAAMWEHITREGSWRGEIWNRKKNGEIYPEWLSITAVVGDDGRVTHYVAAFADITLRKQAEDRIQYLAFYDLLTQLPNRRLLLDRLHHALAASTRSKRLGALLFIDLDNFKTLNDSHGHDKGDLLLQEVGRRLSGCVRAGDTVARLGGDEFVAMLEDLSESPEEAATQAKAAGEKILAALARPYDLAHLEHHATSSIGIALFGHQRENTDEPLKRADLAMYQAKSAGRNTLCFFDPEMQAVVSARTALEADLRKAVQQQQLELHYQAQVDSANRLTGVESLLRWQHRQRGPMSPAQFIPLAEETGLILPLGNWVLETACRQLAAWAARPETAHLTVAVNVSARQFHHRSFVDTVLAALDSSGANPQRLKLELTESLLVSDLDNVIVKMSALKDHGVSFSLDDFGTGYSSLSYLRRLPLDQLKIDQSFVREVLTNQNDAAIVRTIIALGRSLGLAVIAEGVETEAQREFLASSGCLNFQGFLYGRPGPVEQLPIASVN